MLVFKWEYYMHNFVDYKKMLIVIHTGQYVDLLLCKHTILTMLTYYFLLSLPKP